MMTYEFESYTVSLGSSVTFWASIAISSPSISGNIAFSKSHVEEASVDVGRAGVACCFSENFNAAC